MNSHRTPFRLAWILAASFLFAAAAQTPSLPEALRQAEERTGVVTAEMALEDAERTAGRTEADPLSLRIDRVRDRQAAELARAERDDARYDAYLEIAEAYTQVLQLERRLALAEAGLDLSQRGLEIARIREERGGATELDVREAENDLAEARTSVASARQGLALARRSFEGLTGLDGRNLRPVPDALLETPTPELDELRERMDEAPTLLQAQQGLELARVGRDLLDPSYAARSQIDAAELQVSQAEEGATEARRALDLQLRSLIDRVESAREAVEVARDALANAYERQEVERARLEAGLIAEIAYDQARLSTQQAELEAVAAEHDLLLALLRLQAETGVAVEGLNDF